MYADVAVITAADCKYIDRLPCRALMLSRSSSRNPFSGNPRYLRSLCHSSTVFPCPNRMSPKPLNRP